MINALQFLALRRINSESIQFSKTDSATPKPVNQIRQSTLDALAKRGFLVWQSDDYQRWPKITKAGKDAMQDFEQTLLKKIDGL